MNESHSTVILVVISLSGELEARAKAFSFYMCIALFGRFFYSEGQIQT